MWSLRAAGYQWGGELRQKPGGRPFSRGGAARVIPNATKSRQDIADQASRLAQALEEAPERFASARFSLPPPSLSRKLDMHKDPFAQPGIRERMNRRFCSLIEW